MMMRAIAASSRLQVVAHASMDELIRSRQTAVDGYDPNPHGYWHPDERLFEHDDDTGGWLHHFDWRHCLKLTPEELLHWVEEGEARVIWMERPLPEVLVSWERSFGYPYPSGHLDHADRCRDLLDTWMNVTVVQYLDVLDDPVVQYHRLVDAGWPLDPVVAAATVDRALYRNRGCNQCRW